MAKEWYLLEYEQKTYLHKKELIAKSYPGTEGMHDHCELCWSRFSKYFEDLQSGYYESQSQSWICPDCYSKYASLFEWTIASANEE